MRAGRKRAWKWFLHRLAINYRYGMSYLVHLHTRTQSSLLQHAVLLRQSALSQLLRGIKMPTRIYFSVEQVYHAKSSEVKFIFLNYLTSKLTLQERVGSGHVI